MRELSARKETRRNDEGVDTITGMKIVDVRACQPACDSPPDWRTALGQILVAIDTDAGLVGYGVGGGGQSAIHIVRTVLRDLLIGQTARPIESHWRAMYDATLPFGRKGVAIMAISGVDLALWDLRGKEANRSIAELLGGPIHARIPTYATVWDDVPDSLIGQSSAFKLHLGKCDGAVDSCVAQVQRVRERIGPNVALMVDAWMKWDVPFTLRFAERAAPLRLDWIEEPLPPDDWTGYAELMRTSPIPIAGGEHEFTAAAFAELIERRLHHVVQPDVTWCGGMTELVKIYRCARQHGVRVCPHRGAELWASPALAALDPSPLAESGRPWMTWVGGQPASEGGAIEVPNRPGFGAVIDANVWI
ncbi:MAG: mandelate racemase/muconate lactonizing enzyme family protein, partial [Planctomycetes bacterium]|nr:mandelate racemase/muconate lactonizing enzyme family protein [Planctomycetota bacterium]